MTPPVLQPTKADEKIHVKINGRNYDVPKTYSEVSLNDYLREHLQLTGTKVTCREGGCGACIVNAAFPDPLNPGQIIQRSINSCLCPVLSCDGWEILTVEGIGDQKKPHPIQSALTDHYGTQCGYCTPGMVMNMYSLTQSSTSLTKQEIENSFGGNICRCTGYRPILDAFKSFATSTDKICDLEDCGIPKPCAVENSRKCSGSCCGQAPPYVLTLPAAVADFAPEWHKPESLADLYQLLPKYTGRNVYYVVGHTGKGVYNDTPYDVYIDIKGIRDLYAVNATDDSLSLGANIPLREVIEIFQNQAKKAGFKYLNSLADIISRTAHVSVRNVGSWGGNLAMKNRHKEFPSDTFTALAIAKASITVGGPTESRMSVEDFLNTDLIGKVILRFDVPAFADSDYVFRTYKIMPRAQNAHGYVNAGFRVKADKSSTDKFMISESAIVFGNINATFIHAPQTESALNGKDLGDSTVLQQAVAALNKELKPEEKPDEASAKYRKSLACSLLYKFALEVVGGSASERYRSAIGYIPRPVSSGMQTFVSKKENYPLSQPIPKLESMVQCTGEAKYISDIHQENFLHAAFVLTTEGRATIYRIDVTDAMALPGVVRVLTAADIPGENNITFSAESKEELLASSQSIYAGQPAAIVVAETKDIAEAAAKLVKIQYSNVRNPVLSCKDAIREKSFHPGVVNVKAGDAEAAVKSAANQISGEFEIGTQAHFHMETMVAITYPTEDGVDIEAGTQNISTTQDAASKVLGIGKHRINVKIKRNGGGFGAKGGRNALIASASAVAAYILRRPVKMHQSLWDNLKSIGKRFPYYVQYKAGTDGAGKLQGVVLDVYCNIGAIYAYSLRGWGKWGDNAYKCANWKMTLTPCKTNRPPNTYTRAPGSTEAIYTIETIMEHIAISLKQSSLNIKQLNFFQDGDKPLDGSTLTGNRLVPVTNLLLESAQYQERVQAVAGFNNNSRWKKKGLGVIPMRYAVEWQGGGYDCLIAVYKNGGTVAVTHGGIELGQGINTKVAQVIAYELGIDMKYIVIQPTMSITSANNRITAGGISSELLCLSAVETCNLLKANMKPVKDKNPNDSWEDLVEKCFKQGIALTAHQFVQAKSDKPQYSVYGAMCTEVTLDILTGEHQIDRLDLVYDCGESMSPYVDVGQVEGGTIMGLGYFTTEEVIYDMKTGQNLTFGTWKYKPPGAKDIPVDFRVTLLPNAPNPLGVLRSKTTGEAPLCMSSSVVFALRNAIKAHCEEIGKGDTWIRLDAPLTVERLQQYCSIEPAQFRYKD
ncbi:uncharacterized protein LOC129595644 [Paramacrobiotus metropolitanus]|uniref:uncharacterized protein LOC129595644 n=1 Tax=Paramacrobiotus metropolitanus TaxID=2943436 RepID=UPI00244571A0|nr:uncharacterized protein LOC129595644 [Paramacrobiotus metropolitanus]